MAVDSDASLRAGRANWALPKTPAAFAGGRATGDGWSIEVEAASTGLRVPILALALLDQPGGVRSPVRAWGTGRLARVTVATAGATPPWLRAGRHPGVVLDRVRATVGAPYR